MITAPRSNNSSVVQTTNSPRKFPKPRLVHCSGFDAALIDRPDLTSPIDNALRRHLLGDARGYGQNRDFFEGFPADVRWQRVALARAELAEVRYIAYGYWEELTGRERESRR